MEKLMRKYHHLGVPTKQKKAGEKYHGNLKFTSTPFGANKYRIQWHRFEEGCEMHEILKTVPHVAFKVDNLEEEIAGQNVILGPYSPINGYRVAIIITEDGFPVEFVETNYTDEELIALEEQAKEINTDNINMKK
jgi:hypothetical protein